MRTVTSNAVNAFMNDNKLGSGNTTVTVEEGTTKMLLFGNCIAKKKVGEKSFEISNAGWFSATTKERLSCLPDVSLYQQKGIWYLNGKVWNGDWVTISR